MNDGRQIFELWSEQMLLSREFDAETVRTYASIWNAWLSWLAQRSMNWMEVGAPTIQGFLDGPSPGLKHHRPALSVDRMANYTRQRYWRVLRAVYAEAVQRDVLTKSPLLDVAEFDRPVIERSSRQSQVLPPRVLALLRDPLVVESCIPQKRETDWWSLRDRAAMLILSHLGITTGELIALRGQDLVFDKGDLWTWLNPGLAVDGRMDNDGLPPSPALLSSDGGPVALSISKDLEVLPRTLDLNEMVMVLLKPWMAERQRVLSQRLIQRFGAGPVSAAKLREFCLSEPIFMSRQRTKEQIAADRPGEAAMDFDGLGLLPPMDASNVYSFVKRILDAVYKRPEFMGTDPKAHGINLASGAAIIRNSVLCDWVFLVGPATAAQWAGLKSTNYLNFGKV
jgi:integrase